MITNDQIESISVISSGSSYSSSSSNSSTSSSCSSQLSSTPTNLSNGISSGNSSLSLSSSTSPSQAQINTANYEQIAFDFNTIMGDLTSVCGTLSILSKQIDKIVHRIDDKFTVILEGLSQNNDQVLPQKRKFLFNSLNLKIFESINQNGRISNN